MQLFKSLKHISKKKMTGYLYNDYLEIWYLWYIKKELAMMILLYGCTTWILTKHLEKKQDGNKARMLQAWIDGNI